MSSAAEHVHAALASICWRIYSSRIRQFNGLYGDVSSLTFASLGSTTSVPRSRILCRTVCEMFFAWRLTRFQNVLSKLNCKRVDSGLITTQQTTWRAWSGMSCPGSRDPFSTASHRRVFSPCPVAQEGPYRIGLNGLYRSLSEHYLRA